MSLLDEAMEQCIIMDKTTRDDGYGIVTVYVEGAPFMAAIGFDNSMQARAAAIQGVTDRYTVTTRKAVVLQFGDVFKRAYDGKLFRVKSDGKDNATPASAALDMRVVTAEEFKGRAASG